MISTTGWEDEYEWNKSSYWKIFNESLKQKQETDISFLERDLEDFTKSYHCVSCASGSDALEFSLRTLELDENDEVIVPDFSWLSTATAIIHAGAMPVFVDIDKDTFHTTADLIEPYITERTQAVIVPHLFGSMADIVEIQQLCSYYNLYLIEDACQAIGATFKGAHAGTFGDIGTLSFNSNKNIAGIAGGGAILTDTVDLAKAIEKMRQHGGPGEILGRNSKMLHLNASVIAYRLTQIEKWTLARQQLAKIYDNAFENIPEVSPQKIISSVTPTYHKYVVLFNDTKTRNRIMRKLKEKGIPTAVHYPSAISKFPLWEYENCHTNDTFWSSYVSARILTLPLHHTLEPKYVYETINHIMDEI